MSLHETSVWNLLALFKKSHSIPILTFSDYILCRLDFNIGSSLDSCSHCCFWSLVPFFKYLVSAWGVDSNHFDTGLQTSRHRNTRLFSLIFRVVLIWLVTSDRNAWILKCVTVIWGTHAETRLSVLNPRSNSDKCILKYCKIFPTNTLYNLWYRYMPYLFMRHLFESILVQVHICASSSGKSICSKLMLLFVI